MSKYMAINRYTKIQAVLRDEETGEETPVDIDPVEFADTTDAMLVLMRDAGAADAIEVINGPHVCGMTPIYQQIDEFLDAVKRHGFDG